jgi:hypothetical protein
LSDTFIGVPDVIPGKIYMFPTQWRQMSQYVCPDLFPRHTKTHDSPFELNRVPGDDGGNREVEPAPKYGQEDLVSSSDHVERPELLRDDFGSGEFPYQPEKSSESIGRERLLASRTSHRARFLTNWTLWNDRPRHRNAIKLIGSGLTRLGALADGSSTDPGTIPPAQNCRFAARRFTPDSS